MGRLVKRAENGLFVAHNFVHTPNFSLYVADYSVEGEVRDGWYYYADDLEQDDFVPSWKQPTGAEDAYALGTVVWHSDKMWRSTITANVWEPGVSGWVEVTTTESPAWVQPTGAHDAYAKDAVVQHNGSEWKSELDANVWEPGVYGWKKAMVAQPPQTPTIPAWVQPTGAHDAYPLNALVTHSGSTWKSTTPANVWEPGVYGWIVV